MSLSKLVQNDYAHEGKPTFAKTRHGPLVMVNNHSTQVFEQHLAVGIRCKTPVWLCTLPLRLKVFKVEFQSVIVRARQGAGWPDKYRRMSKPWHSTLPTPPKPTTAARICPTSLPILRLDNIHASHSIPLDHVQCGSLDLLMHHYCQSSSLYRHLQTSFSLNLIIRSYAPDHYPDDIHGMSWSILDKRSGSMTGWLWKRSLLSSSRASLPIASRTSRESRRHCLPSITLTSKTLKAFSI